MKFVQKFILLSSAILLLAGCASKATFNPSPMMGNNPQATLGMEVTPIAFYCRHGQWPTTQQLQTALKYESFNQTSPYQYIRTNKKTNNYQVKFKLNNVSKRYIYDYQQAPSAAECHGLSVSSQITSQGGNTIRATITPKQK